MIRHLKRICNRFRDLAKEKFAREDYWRIHIRGPLATLILLSARHIGTQAAGFAEINVPHVGLGKIGIHVQ